MKKHPILALLPLLWGLSISHLAYATINTSIDDALSASGGGQASPFSISDTSLPAPPNSDNSNITAPYYKVDAGSSLVCAIRNKDRGIDCWGLNDFGQLNTPTKGRFKFLSAGQHHACAINLKNQLLCWGSLSARPTVKQARDSYIDVSSGDNHTCAIQKGNNRITCWGDNTYGQTEAPQGAFKVLSARNNQSCGIRMNGKLSCWGKASFTGYPQPVGFFSDISVGKLHACATRKPDGAIVCWGNGIYGTTTAPIGNGYISVFSGDYHTCATRTDRSVVCWGRDQWGQVSGAPQGPVTSVGAGGALTCSLNPNRRLSCRGSFAYNDVTYGPQQSQAVKPTLWGPVEKAITGSIGYGLIKWGESMEKGSTGQAFAFFVAGLLGSKNDANKDRFQEIQKSLTEINQQLVDITQKLGDIKQDINQGACQTALSTIQTSSYYVDLDGAYISYMALIKRTDNDLTNRIEYGSSPDLTIPADMDAFADKLWDTPLNSKLKLGLAGLHKLLVQIPATSPLVKCVDADLANFQNTATHPFDDRALYTQSYNFLQLLELMQVRSAVILQDINARRALKTLTDPSIARDPKAPPIPVAQIPEQGLCGEIRRQVGSLGYPAPLEQMRWIYAIDYCNASTNVVNATYKRLVQQIEFTGAPYTDENVVLSMGNTIFPHGSSATNWLWLRPGKFSLDEVSYKHNESIGGFGYLDGVSSGFPVSRDLSGKYSSITFKNGGDANWYSSGDVGERFDGIWHGAGQAWAELYSSYDGYLDKKKVKGDLITMMADAKGVPVPVVKKDMDKNGNKIEKIVNEPDSLFPNISATPFWMTSQFFNMEWNRLGGDDLTSAKTLQVRCFVAAKINPTWYYSDGGSKNPKVTLRTTGQVCSSEGFAGMSRSKPSNGGNLYLMNGIENRDMNDEYYKPYKSLLGSYAAWIYSSGTLSPIEYGGLLPAVYFNNGVLPHYPVLDVSQRRCMTPIVLKNAETTDPSLDLTRSNTLTRGNGSIQLPTRCGSDMDKFINNRIPRPDSLSPDDARVPQF
jgi:hypothetical protein